VRGVGAEYFSTGTNPVWSLERHQEAHDLVIQAWTRPGPFAFEGKHYHYEYVNVWPRPFQKPHPPIWIPSQGSRETIDFAAHPDHKYTYLQTFSPIAAVEKYLHLYKDVARGFGYEASPRQLGWATPLYVGDTDESAFEEAALHYERFRGRFLGRMPLEMLMPPGYTSRASMMGIISAKSAAHTEITAKKAHELGMWTCGSAETVADTLISYMKRIGFGNFLGMMQFGTLPAGLTKRSMERFAEKVMPKLKLAAKELYREEMVA